MSRYAVQAATFSEAIHVGRLEPNGKVFAEKEAHTDMVLAAVAQYVQRNYDGGMRTTFPGLGIALEVNVTDLAEPQGPDDTEDDTEDEGDPHP